MRLGKLGPAMIAATSLLALAPAAASAHKHPSPLGRCTINIRVAPRQITAGEPVEVKGRLKCGRRAIAGGQAVTLYAVRRRNRRLRAGPEHDDGRERLL